MNNPANLDFDLDPNGLVKKIAEAQAANEQAADQAVTIADVAAAAFVALETVVALMPNDELKQRVIAEFESRAAVFAVSMEEEG